MKAIDIVLLPEGNALQDCIAIHEQSKQEGRTQLSLSTDCYLPHLSLLMGKADDATITQIITILQQHFSDIAILLNCTHMDDSWLVVDRSNELMDLHTRLMDTIYPLLDHETPGRDDMFFEYEQEDLIDQNVYPWINDFASKAYDQYEPHITLGDVDELPMELPLYATTSRLALFHLSNYNTCKQLLWENK